MNAKTKALNNKLIKSFSRGNKAVGSGRLTVTLGHSESGPCKFCRQNAGRKNIKNGNFPPHHPNCACNLTEE